MFSRFDSNNKTWQMYEKLTLQWLESNQMENLNKKSKLDFSADFDPD